LKIYGITKLKTDLIFLSDLRIHGKDVQVVNNLKKSFLCNPYGQYEFFFNSENNRRGVGILIKKSLDFAVESELRDSNNNILGLLIRIEGEQILLISVYGPNQHCEKFFLELGNILDKHKGTYTILGGDWNLTPSPLNVSFNPDVINMCKLPNEKHTRLLQSIQIRHSLVDAFRILYPTRKEFSYSA
jgi:exonuclease III